MPATAFYSHEQLMSAIYTQPLANIRHCQPHLVNVTPAFFLIWQCIPLKKILCWVSAEWRQILICWLDCLQLLAGLTCENQSPQRDAVYSLRRNVTSVYSWFFSSYVRCLVKHKQGFIGSYEPMSKEQKMKRTESEEEKCRVNITTVVKSSRLTFCVVRGAVEQRDSSKMQLHSHHRWLKVAKNSQPVTQEEKFQLAAAEIIAFNLIF